MQKAGIAIVGAGVSGLYAAWRLQQRGMTDWMLIEARDTLGGRILSVPAPSAGQSPQRALGSIRKRHIRSIAWVTESVSRIWSAPDSTPRPAVPSRTRLRRGHSLVDGTGPAAHHLGACHGLHRGLAAGHRHLRGTAWG